MFAEAKGRLTVWGSACGAETFLDSAQVRLVALASTGPPTPDWRLFRSTQWPVSFGDLLPGDYEVSLRRVGHRPLIGYLVRIRAGEAISLHVALHPSARLNPQ